MLSGVGQQLIRKLLDREIAHLEDHAYRCRLQRDRHHHPYYEDEDNQRLAAAEARLRIAKDTRREF